MKRFVHLFAFLSRGPMVQNLAVIVATCMCLCACAQIIDHASTDAETSQQASAPEQSTACAKATELEVGIAERRPQRTSDVITRDGKKVTVWVYGSMSLQLSDDKLIRILDLDQQAKDISAATEEESHHPLSRGRARFCNFPTKMLRPDLGGGPAAREPGLGTGRGGDVTGSANSFLSARRNRGGRGTWFAKRDPRVRIGL